MAQTGCSYIIVGHSEERSQGISGEQVAQKALRTLEAGLIPIVCIGESKTAHESGNTQAVLRSQLAPLKEAIGSAPAYIAYEPVWSIGSGKVPSQKELSSVFEFLKSEMPGCAYLYGGSVTVQNVADLAKIKEISGFLIGGASLTFTTFHALCTKV